MLKNKISKLLLATLTSVFAFILIPEVTHADTPVSGTIDSNTTWTEANSPYILNGAVTIAEGVTLTIDPDVVVKGAYSGSALRVQGTLNSVASSTDSIYFTSLQDDTVGGDTNSDATSTTPAGSDWSGILVDSTGTANLDHTVIRYAGYHSYPYYSSSNIRNQGGILNISNSEIASSSAYGVRHSSGTTTVSNTNIINNSSPGVYSNGGTGSLSVTDSYFGNNSEAFAIDGSGGLIFTTSGNSGSAGGISLSGTIAQDTTLEQNGIPYILNGAVTIAEGVTLTIASGVVVKGAYSGSALRVQGTLDSTVSSTSPAYFTSLQDDTVGGDTNSDGNTSAPAGSDWSGILVDSTGTADLDHTIIRYAGYHSWPYYGSSNIRNQGGILSITNSELASSSAYGVRHSSGTTTVSNSNIINNSSPGVYSNGGAGFLSVTGSYFENNSEALSIDGSGGLAFTLNGNSGATGGLSLSGTIAQNTILEQNEIPYIISGSLTVAEGVTLSVGPGVLVKGAHSGSGISVEGTLDISASSTNPVYFTSLQDDTVGGDTNNDGTSSAPAGNDWSGIVVASTGTVNLDYAVVRYAGYHSYPYYSSSNIRNQGGVLNIVNSEIASSSAYGVRHSSGTTTVSNTNIINNSSPGVYNDDSSYLVDATNNWWGDASGPYNSTTNASGTGSTVSDYVDFSDWLTEPVVFGGTTTTPPTCTENCYSNVLFLPGIMGSKLSSSTDECWFDYLESDGTISGSDEEFKCILMTGTETPYTDPVYATEVLADAGPFGAIEVYESILNDLDAWDSELGIEHEALPYDWRYDFETIVRHTASTSNGMYVDPSASVSDSNNPFYLSVTNLASTSKTGKVTVVAHSMGGLVAKEMMIYLEEKGLEDKIDRIILVASPQLGTPKGFGALLHGYDMALDPLGVSLDEAEARYLSRNMQSVYNLLPSAEYFSSVSNPVAVMGATTSVTQKNTSGDTIAQFDTADNVLITNHGQYLASASLQMLFMTDDINRTRPEFDDVDAAEVVPYEYVSRADTVHDSLDAWTPPDGVELITVAGWGLETFGQAEYKRYVTEVCDGSCTVVEERVVMSPITTIEGDETVVAPSALYSSNDTNVERWWLDLEDYKDSNTNRDHSDIFAVDDLRLLVKSTLTGSSSSYTYLHTSTSTLSNPTGNRMQYLLHSPLTLGFRDAQGRYTGLKEDGTVIEEIPGTSYQLFGEVKFLSIPEEISGELEMIGIDDGKFTLEVRKVTGTSKIVEESAFVAVDTKKGMRVSLAQEGKKRSSIDKSLKNLELTIDKYDGKGEQEVKTFEYNAKIYKTRNMEKMEKQPKFEETATSTNKINSNENSTTTESVTEHMEPNNATSTATSTSSGPASSDKFPAGLLPLTMASVFGIEIKRFKKKVAVSSALFLAFGVGLYLVLFVPYWLSLIDLRTVGNIRRAITFGLDDDVFWMTMTILPAILVSLSLLHYKSREGVYKAWLVYSTLGLVTFIYFVVYTETHSSGWFGPMFVFVPLGIVYIAGSIIIWFYGFLTRKRHVK